MSADNGFGEEREKSTAPFDVTVLQFGLPKGGAINGVGKKLAGITVTMTGALTVPIAPSPGRSTLVTPDGLRHRALGDPRIPVRDVRWTADRFLRADKERATGLWLLGEVQQ